MEKILQVNEIGVEGSKAIGWPQLSPAQPDMTGYQVITDLRTIGLLVEAGTKCCEDWGYIVSDDMPERFIGAELTEVYITDEALKNVKIPEDEGNHSYTAIFINLQTTKGLLQFAVYNGHNGYYGHLVTIQIGDTIKVKSI